MSPASATKPLHAVIIGGSLGGLCAAHALRGAGCTVEIFEKSAQTMSDRGAGLVVQPDVFELLDHLGLPTRQAIGVPSRRRQSLRRDGSIEHSSAALQLMTSWDTMYSLLRDIFPDEFYHHGYRLQSFEQCEDGVDVQFTNGERTAGDLLVCCDGSNSTARHQLLPSTQPEYAGYVAWRGVVDEQDLPPAAAAVFTEAFTLYQMPHSHILGYLIPGLGGTLEPGRRRFNWVWYWNVPAGTELKAHLTDRTGLLRDYSIPPGAMDPALVAQQRAIAQQVLPPVFQLALEATKDLFVQPIYDLAVPQMAFERVALLGDSAFVSRPHTASGTAKVAVNARGLGEAVQAHGHDVTAALRAWEPAQLRYGNYLKVSGKAMGDRSQFGR